MMMIGELCDNCKIELTHRNWRAGYSCISCTNMDKTIYKRLKRNERYDGCDPDKATKKLMKQFAKSKDCPICGVRLNGGNVSIDHIHPLAEGGANHRGNFQLLCGSCNSRKGKKISKLKGKT